jgi:hypothetical protein
MIEPMGSRGGFVFFMVCVAAFWFYVQDHPVAVSATSGATNARTDNTRNVTTTGTMAGTVDPTQFAGSDIGAQINAAVAACTGNALHLRIPPGKYSFSTPIVFSGSCMPQIDAEGVVMEYGGRGQAITFSGLNVSGGFAEPKVLRGLHLTHTGRGSRSAVGIAVGDTTGTACCAVGIRLENVWIENFGIDLLFGSNAWNFSATGDYFSAGRAGSVLVSVPDAKVSGESLRFTNSTFFSTGAFLTNAINVANGGASSSWDGDNFDNVEVEFLSGNNGMSSPYWENPDAAIPAGHFFLVARATGALFNPYFFANRGWAGREAHFMADIEGNWTATASLAKSRDASPCTAVYQVASNAHFALTGVVSGCNPLVAAQGASTATPAMIASPIP